MADVTHNVASTCLDHHGSADGMPQLCSDWLPNQVFWLALALLAIFFILSRIALPRIASVLAERQGTITNDISAAEELKRRAGEAEAAYEQALTDARAEAHAIAAKTREEIAEDLAAATVKADEEISVKTAESEKAIDDIRASAMASIEIVATDTAAAVVAALGRKADEAAIAAAVAKQVKG